MKKRFLPLCMLLITMVLAQASFVANAAENQGKYTPRSGSKATISSFMKSIRANQETGLIDPALMMAARKAAQATSKDRDLNWDYAGPDNFGGMTRALLYHQKTKNGKVIQTILIGTMGGDIYESENGGITFGRITNRNLPISCMVKANDGTIYVGTGDGREAQYLNGLSVIGEASSFVGEGVFTLDLENKTLNPVNGTQSIDFVNEMAVAGDDVFAATSNGLMKNWTVVIEGNFRSVKANNNGDVLAADDNKVYLKKNGSNEYVDVTAKITGSNSNPKIIAMSPNDANYMYIAYMKGSANAYQSDNIYFTNDGGETWTIGVAGTSLYSILTYSASHDGFMTVHPENPRKVFVGSYNLWLLEDADNLGVYRPTQISYAYTSPISSIYVHNGIQNVVFNPKKPNTFFVGTNGGIFKGKYAQGDYRFTNCNRYFITDDQHCSPTRMMSVGIGGTQKILGACLDHGTIRIDRYDTVNSLTTGIGVFPNPDAQSNANQQFGYYDPAFAGGPCAISTIDPNMMFVTGTGDLSTPLHRTQSNGEDYDLTKFLGGESAVITNSDAFKTPFAFYENYNNPDTQLVLRYKNLQIDTIDYTVYDSTYYVYDTVGGVYQITDTIHVHDSVWNTNSYYVDDIQIIKFDTLVLGVKDSLFVGSSCYYYSGQAGYPIDLIVPELPDSLVNPAHLDGRVWLKGDTIRDLHDPLSTIMVVGINNAVYFTRYSLLFDKDAKWLQLGTIDGLPTAVTMSADGTFALVGTVGGKLYKFPRLNNIYVAEQVDARLTSPDSLNYIYNKKYTNDTVTLLNTFPQAITSIAIDPTANDTIVVTLGNYGEGNKYVYRATDGATFNAVAANNLPNAPVYSCIIEKDTKNIIVGSEFGIFISTDNGANWTKSGNISCPVMDIKQAIVPNHPDKIDYLYDEMGQATKVVYPGVSNEGMIYAATYGEGIVFCNPNAVEAEDDNDNEDDVTETRYEHLNVYPNPVKDNAQVNIKLDNNAAVSYVIYDLSGRMVINNELGTYVKGIHTLNIDTATLPKGSYIIRVNAGDKSESTKFLVY